MSAWIFDEPPGDGWHCSSCFMGRGVIRDYWHDDGRVARVVYFGIAFCWIVDNQQEQDEILAWEQEVRGILQVADMNGCVYDGKPPPRDMPWPAPPKGARCFVEARAGGDRWWSPIVGRCTLWMRSFAERAEDNRLARAS